MDFLYWFFWWRWWCGNGTNGHDAGTGTDAGNSQASAMLINSTNVSFWGDVTYSTDTDDYYKVSMPAYFGVKFFIKLEFYCGFRSRSLR